MAGLASLTGVGARSAGSGIAAPAYIPLKAGSSRCAVAAKDWELNREANGTLAATANPSRVNARPRRKAVINSR